MIQDDRKQDIDVHNIKKSDLVFVLCVSQSVSQCVRQARKDDCLSFYVVLLMSRRGYYNF